MEGKDLGKTSVGIQANVAGVLCYLGIFVTGIIFYLLEKENKFVRFHALQSIVASAFMAIALSVLRLMPYMGWILANILSIVGLILWIVLMVKAYQGEYFKLPGAGDFAEKNS
jgi:uncharacterized membrane protein